MTNVVIFVKLKRRQGSNLDCQAATMVVKIELSGHQEAPVFFRGCESAAFVVCED